MSPCRVEKLAPAIDLQDNITHPQSGLLSRTATGDAENPHARTAGLSHPNTEFAPPLAAVHGRLTSLIGTNEQRSIL